MEGSDTTQAYATLRRTIENLRAQGICYACHDLETGELFRVQHVVPLEDEFTATKSDTRQGGTAKEKVGQGKDAQRDRLTHIQNDGL